MSTLLSPLTSPIPNTLQQHNKTDTSIKETAHYYDDPYFFQEDQDQTVDHDEQDDNKQQLMLSPISFHSTHTFHSNASLRSPTTNSSYYSAPSTYNNSSNNNSMDNYQHNISNNDNNNNNNDNDNSNNYIHQSSLSIRQLSGSPPPKHPPNQPQKSRKKDGSFIYNVYGQNGKRIMLLEIIHGKSQIVAATKEQLFLKLADESPQDFDFVDTFLSNHPSFTTSQELLYSLIDRFHLEPAPGHEYYFQQWQKRIQVKVLNVLTRWIKLQFRDFLGDISLHNRLESFCDLDMIKAGFVTEATMIKDAMYNQKYRYYQSIYNLQPSSSSHHIGFAPTTPPLSLRRPSGSGSLFSIHNNNNNSNNSNSQTPPDSPVYPIPHPNYHHQISNHHHSIGTSPLLSLDTKEIAKYLTLADYYLFQQMKSYDYLDGHWRHCQYNDLSLEELELKEDFIGILTKRANMLNHWVIHELATTKSTKHKRSILRKFIEIAKLCLEWNNFHTSMILTMGLLSNPVQKIEDVWQSLPNRNQLTFDVLKKLVDVSHNMSFYRQALQEGGLHPGLFLPQQKKRSPSFTLSIKESSYSTSATTSTSTYSSSLPTLPFFPVVLKDITFLMENDSFYKEQQHQDNHCHPSIQQQHDIINDEEDLVYFSKFYGLSRYVTKIMHYTTGHYWFSVELETKPFLSHHRLSNIFDSTRTSFSSNNVTLQDHSNHHLSSSSLPPPPPPPHSNGLSSLQYNNNIGSSTSLSSALNTSFFFSSPFPTSFLSHHHHHSKHSNNNATTLDQVADIIEKRIASIASCYTDPQCESYLSSLLKPL
ncbi:ras guanine nucleotide exchange factor domain-containing protein [Cunninghamella echinulata]|nr:ras guanine nucleotide exchange factor domain-containing protein [Cunninghamella echinulata]